MNQLSLLPVRVLSYGGGADSFAMLLRAIELGDRPDVVAFADVAGGTARANSRDPGEWPITYEHIRRYALPVCEAAGIPFVWIGSEIPVRDALSLIAWMEARGQIPIAGPARICTVIAKVERFEKWLRSYAGSPAETWIGFEAGEESRAAKDPNAGKPSAFRRNRFPLIEWGWCRCRCENYIRSRGYPVPPKSACVFCPYATKGDWQRFAAQLPKQFTRVERMEAAKPPTKAGKKLSIMGYRTLPDGTYRAPPIREFIKGSYTPKKRPCTVCGAPERASKAAGCSDEMRAT